MSSKKETDPQEDEIIIEEKLKNSEEKLLRSLADSENQRRRFEKEIKDAFEFGGFNLTVPPRPVRRHDDVHELSVLKS